MLGAEITGIISLFLLVKIILIIINPLRDFISRLHWIKLIKTSRISFLLDLRQCGDNKMNNEDGSLGKDYKDGETIFEENSIGKEMYIILTGKAKIIKKK